MASSVKSEIWEDVRLKTTCYGCSAGTCGMIVRRVNGIVVSAEGDPECPFSQGKLCAKGHAQIMMAYNARRVTKPLKRTNPEKGIGVDPKWVEISYEEAITTAAAKLKHCMETEPAGLVLATTDFPTLPWFPGSSLVSHGSLNFTTAAKTFCGNNVHPMLQQVHGGFHAGPDFHHCKYVMLIGSQKGAMSNWAAVTSTTEMARARQKGMKLVVVDPWCSNAAAIADEWVPIRPGTDGALILSMINLLVNEFGLYDVDFLRKLSNGPYLVQDSDGHYARDEATNKPLIWDEADRRAKCWDDPTLKSPAMAGSFQVGTRSCTPAFALLRKHLADYSPERVADITTVPAGTIRRLAKEFGTAASIGKTIDIDGHRLPLRPACAHWYKGIGQHSTGFEQGVSIAMLNTIIGAIDVPGGLSADTVYAHHPKYSEHSTWMGKGSGLNEADGIVVPGAHATYGGAFLAPYPARDIQMTTISGDALAAASSYMGGGIHHINALDPTKFNKVMPSNPLVYVQIVSNDMVNEGNPKTQSDYHKKVGFQLSIVPNIDETAEFADIIIPTQTQLERLDMGANCIPDTMGSTGTGDYCINLRQPVIDIGNRHFVDIWLDIAEQDGTLAAFNQTASFLLQLSGDYVLKPDHKYTHRQITENWIRSMTGGSLSLSDVAKEGRISWPKTVQERYPRAFYSARIPVYYEYHLNAGVRIKEVTRSMNIQWDTSRYQPLPSWYPSAAHIERTDGFELFGVTFKWPFMTATFSNFNAWLSELAVYHPYAGKIVLNRSYALAKGIQEGDQVRVENIQGQHVEGPVVLSECIHPECVGVDHASGSWAKCLTPRRGGTGVHYGTLLAYDMKNQDVMSGAMEASPKLKVSLVA